MGILWICALFVGTILAMSQTGRPKSETPKTEFFKLRLTDKEKQAFSLCANLSGIPIAAWVRERLRKAAIHDLEEAGQKVPFLRIPE
jgi:hypothetical protein